MIDKDKIRIMAKMAVYDKKGFERDARANQYFRHDFIYKRNMQMRFHLGIGCIILAIFYIMYLLLVREHDLFALNFQAEAIRLLTFVIVIMVGYSFIGTIVFTREFLVSQKRVEAYFALMKELSGEEAEKPAEDAPKAAEIDDEPEYEHFEPYRRRGENLPEYRYPSTDDPEFWEDDK
ncbi:MAG: hypothetical protein LBE35_09925 [Clostridiales bacterium]|jgi:hypothetical protein|nr:hypothetical protein [Clostridiales bacterium]